MELSTVCSQRGRETPIGSRDRQAKSHPKEDSDEQVAIYRLARAGLRTALRPPRLAPPQTGDRACVFRRPGADAGVLSREHVGRAKLHGNRPSASIRKAIRPGGGARPGAPRLERSPAPRGRFHSHQPPVRRSAHAVSHPAGPDALATNGARPHLLPDIRYGHTYEHRRGSAATGDCPRSGLGHAMEPQGRVRRDFSRMLGG